MLFEVYKDGQGKFMCSDTSCLPTESQLKSMNKNGRSEEHTSELQSH